MTASWSSSVSRVDSDKVFIRGYDLEQLIGGQSFTASCFLLLRGRIPTPAEVRTLDAVLNAVLDYALLKPGTVVALATQATCSQWNPYDPALQDPPGCDWFVVPPEP